MISTNVWVLKMKGLGSGTPNTMIVDVLRTVMERRLAVVLRSSGSICTLANKSVVMRGSGGQRIASGNNVKSKL